VNKPEIDYRYLYFKKEEVLNNYINKEWIATRRAMLAERQVKKLRKQLLDNGIEPVE
jgi:hypothetical protein